MALLQQRLRPFVVALLQRRPPQVGERLEDTLLVAQGAAQRQALFIEWARPSVVPLVHGHVPEAIEDEGDSAGIAQRTSQVATLLEEADGLCVVILAFRQHRSPDQCSGPESGRQAETV